MKKGLKIRITSLVGNNMKLDGGSMFGNAPKALWNRWLSCDEQNRIDIASRSLLIETEHEKILFEAGVGNYLDPSATRRGCWCRISRPGIANSFSQAI